MFGEFSLLASFESTRMAKNCPRMSLKTCKRKKTATRVVVRPAGRGFAKGQRIDGVPGTIEYQRDEAVEAGVPRPNGVEKSPAASVEDNLACVLCHWTAPSFPKLTHHIGYYHKVSYDQWYGLAEAERRRRNQPVKVEAQSVPTVPILTQVPRIPRGHGGCNCHRSAGVADPVDGPRDVYGRWTSGRRYVYHDLDGVSHVRKTTSRQVQWGVVPRVVFEVRSPGEIPLYLIGDRLGGYYSYELPENCPAPGMSLGL